MVKTKKSSKQKSNWQTKKCNCPKIKHTDYNLKEFKWNNKYFYRVFLPLFSNSSDEILKRLNQGFKELKSKGYKFNEKNHMILHEEDRWYKRGDLLIEVENVDSLDPKIKLLDKKHVFSKAHIGHVKNAHQSLKTLGIHINGKGKKIKDVYYWYVSCPHCTKHVEDFKTIIFVEVE